VLVAGVGLLGSVETLVVAEFCPNADGKDQTDTALQQTQSP